MDETNTRVNLLPKPILKTHNHQDAPQKRVKFININKKPRTKNKNKKIREKLKLIYINANGITGKITSLQNNIQEYQANICCIAETKLKTNPPPIEGYNWEIKNRTNRQGGGVAILTQNNLKATQVTDLEEQNQEVIWVEIKHGNQKTYIGCYYGPQESAPREEVEREISQLKTQIIKLKKQGRVILTGDFNAKLEINKTNQQQKISRNGQQLLELINETDLTPITLKSDRGFWTRQNRNNPNEKSMIDYILTDKHTAKRVEEVIIDEAGTHRLKGTNETDHNTILVTIEIETHRKNEKITTWNKGTEQQWEKYNNTINEKAHQINSYKDLEIIITNTLEESIGKKTITINQNKTKESASTKLKRANRNKCRKVYKQSITNNLPDKTEKLEKYISSQKELKLQIEADNKAKTQQIANRLIQEGGAKSSNFWKLRKQIIKKKTDSYDTITEDGQKIEDPDQTKEHIANFYENLYQAREGKQEYANWTKTIKETVKNLDIQSKSEAPARNATLEELQKVIKQLKNNKATGPDNIPNEIFTKANENTMKIYLNAINKIIQTNKIPPQWLEGEIIRLYKGKGIKGKCSNERGITLASNFGKVFERIINNRITPRINMTEAQAGGQKGAATVDHLMRLKDTIRHIRSKRKPTYIAFLDVTKAYDKAWLDSIMYVMNKHGTDLPTWRIIKDLNTNLTATLKTKHGPTRSIKIRDSIRQGGVLSVIQYALLMDEINKEIINQKIGLKINNHTDPIGCLLWMDDVALIAEEPNQLQLMLNITSEIANRYHIEFGATKSKILKIGKSPTNPDFTLGEMKMEYVTKYKYLGETLNYKENLENHTKEIKKKTEAAYQTILSIMGNKYFNRIEMETAWRLIETCIQPIITYGGETWKTTKKEIKEINRIQENIIRRTLMVPQSTPTEALYIETGLLDINSIVTKNRINMEKRLLSKPHKLTTKIMISKPKGGWKETTEHIKEGIQPHGEQPITNRTIEKHFYDHITQRTQGKTKTQYLLTNTEWKAGQRPKYMKVLNRTEVSTIFKARTRMLDIKHNFKGKYQDTKCRLCSTAEETQEHILEKCHIIHKDETTKISTNRIFNENPAELKVTAKIINRIILNLQNI